MSDSGDVKGSFDGRFKALRDILAANLESGEDLGASVAVTVEGHPVVDLWGGWSDEGRQSPWGEDTITNVWSTTKTMTNLCALVLADRGLLDVDAPVARYWPEFAANGKEGVLVRQVLSHTSGVSGWAQPVTVEDIFDWERSTAMLAAQAPWWSRARPRATTPSTRDIWWARCSGASMAVRSGASSPRRWPAPRGDFHIGLDPSDDHRVSDVIAPPPLDIDLATLDMDSVAVKTFTGPAPDASVANTTAWRRAEIGAAKRARQCPLGGAHPGRRGQRRHARRRLAALAVDRRPHLPRAVHGVDLVLGLPLRFGIGYGLTDPETFAFLPSGRVCHWVAGAGRSSSSTWSAT